MSDKEVTEFELDFPGLNGLHLMVAIDGCKLTIAPGADRWVLGRSTYGRPPGPEIEEDGPDLTITQRYVRSELTNLFRVAGDSPLLELQLGADEAYHMTLDSSGDDSKLDLGGLPLRSLRVSDKLGSNDVDFSAPNPGSMDTLEVDIQGSTVRLINLANAHFKRMIVTGKAATCKLGFAGDFQQDCTVSLEAAETPTTLYIPPDLAAHIHAADGAELDATNIELSADDGFTYEDGAYWTQVARNGDAPLLTVSVKPLGPLTLKTLLVE